MFAAPELVEAESVEMGDEHWVAPELQHRVLADRVMRREEAAELKGCGHGPTLWSGSPTLRVGSGAAPRRVPDSCCAVTSAS